MRQIATLTLFMFLAIVSIAQTTAFDWSKEDCNGNTHTLYTELDSGYTIICEYVMLPGCQPCITAGGYLQDIRDAFEISNPGKVRLYSTAFNNSYTCTQMTDWVTDNSLSPNAEFTHGDAEVDYYGGMGMPTIVVVGGGTEHKVYYQDQGFSANDVDDIEAAINASLSEATGVNDVTGTDLSFTVFPNPASAVTTIRYQLSSAQPVSVELYDLVGSKILTSLDKIQTAGKHEITLNTSSIQNGSYFIKLKAGNETKIINLRIVH